MRSKVCKALEKSCGEEFDEMGLFLFFLFFFSEWHVVLFRSLIFFFREKVGLSEGNIEPSA